MIGSVSNYSSYTSTSSTTATNSARSQQFQKELFAKLDSNCDGSVDKDELKSALSQKSDNGVLVSLTKNFSKLDSDSSSSTSSASSSTDSSAALLKALDTDNSGGISSDELKTALQAGRSQDNRSQSNKANIAEALSKMIANLSKQYQLNNVATVGTNLNVAT